MRTLEEVKEYLATEGIKAEELIFLTVYDGLIVSDSLVKVSDKTYYDFKKWYTEDEKVEDVAALTDEIELDEFESYLAGLWINIHDIATEAIENPDDVELRVRSFVKVNTLVKAIRESLGDGEIALETEDL